jgi:hypothetical protein
MTTLTVIVTLVLKYVEHSCFATSTTLAQLRNAYLGEPTDIRLIEASKLLIDTTAMAIFMSFAKRSLNQYITYINNNFFWPAESKLNGHVTPLLKINQNQKLILRLERP